MGAADLAHASGNWLAGIAVHYQPSSLVINGTSTLSNIVVGKRLPSRQVVTYSDARPRFLDQLMPSDGRWRVLAFLGDVRLDTQLAAMHKLAAYLGTLQRFTPPDRDVDGLIECLTIVATPRIAFSYEAFPNALRPIKGPHGYRGALALAILHALTTSSDHLKASLRTLTMSSEQAQVFSDEMSYHAGHGQAYAGYGIDPAVGALILVRPDGYVSYVGALDAFDVLSARTVTFSPS